MDYCNITCYVFAIIISQDENRNSQDKFVDRRVRFDDWIIIFLMHSFRMTFVFIANHSRSIPVSFKNRLFKFFFKFKNVMLNFGSIIPVGSIYNLHSFFTKL